MYGVIFITAEAFFLISKILYGVLSRKNRAESRLLQGQKTGQGRFLVKWLLVP